ncbi:MAG: Bax inhibitor-1 family protein, partial [Candidatus Nanohaloarchaea archaeon]|nr:Bax inhibitor-1 family protein [Candidatus Nanohaloarchaea archaeon]
MYDVTGYSAEAKKDFLQRTLPIFGFMLLITGIVVYYMAKTGMWQYFNNFGIIGMLALLVLQVGIFYGAQAFRKMYPLNIGFAMAFAALEGAIISPLIASFLEAGMSLLIGQALAITSMIMFGLAAVVWVTGRDFSFLGGFLIMGVFGLIGISLFSFFVQMPSFIGLALNIASVVIFSLFVLYDMSKILKNQFGAVAGA